MGAYAHTKPRGFYTGAALGEDRRQGEYLSQFPGGGANWLLELAPFRIIRCTLFLFSLGSGLIKTPNPLRRDLYIYTFIFYNSLMCRRFSVRRLSVPVRDELTGHFHVRGVFSCHLTVRCFAI